MDVAVRSNSGGCNARSIEVEYDKSVRGCDRCLILGRIWTATIPRLGLIGLAGDGIQELSTILPEGVHHTQAQTHHGDTIARAYTSFKKLSFRISTIDRSANKPHLLSACPRPSRTRQCLSDVSSHAYISARGDHSLPRCVRESGCSERPALHGAARRAPHDPEWRPGCFREYWIQRTERV